VVIDEAQWFAHESLGEMLRLGRRANVHLIVATQAVESLPEPVQEAVWTNVADFVAFRGSPQEAREFSHVAGGLLPESLLSLPRGEAAVLIGKGNALQWVRTARVPCGGAPPEWGGDPLPGLTDRGPGGVAPSVRNPREPYSTEDPAEGASVEPVLAAVLACARRGGGDLPVRISIAELRHAVDPDGRGVRAAGGLLGRAGAIVRRDRDGDGAGWWVDPVRLERVGPATASADGKTGASPPQPS